MISRGGDYLALRSRAALSSWMRHIMPLIVLDDQLVVSIPEQDGTMHDYTFSMQPNDLVLRPIRSGCFDF
jgi:hypothetical protein